MTGIQIKRIEVPLEIYREFCAILDAGIQLVDEMNTANGGSRMKEITWKKTNVSDL
jgi:hypothetical protein